jgi:hypothetical protein
MGEWRWVITDLRHKIANSRRLNITTINVDDFEKVLNELEDNFEIANKFEILDRINNPNREYDKNLDHYIKYMKEQNAEYRQYTQLVITAGYAAFFGLWSLTKDFLNPWPSKVSFLLLAISALSFIILEVVKIGLYGFDINVKNKALLLARIEDDLDRRLDHLKSADRYKNRFDLWISRIWIFSYPISLIFGLAAIFILASALVKNVLETAPQALF